ncbi:MAG: substrate-binding domain-containing protein [Clostridiales bacterium]|jgi:ribose transport system substrate-binding protein|nr:substrate-binding domain-containing protein [Clostridiales bacterium]
MKIKLVLPIAFFLASAACIVLFIMNEPAFHNEKTLYEISAVVSGPQDNYWEAVKKGMDQASSDFNVDLNFISLSGADYTAEQESQIRREIENGAAALIVAPCSGDLSLEAVISSAAKKAAVVMIESESDNESIKASVSADNEELGGKLGRQIALSEGIVSDAAVISTGSGAQYEEARLEGLLSEMSAGRAPEVFWISGKQEDMEDEIKNLVRDNKPSVLAALDARTLSAAAAACEKEGTAVYGIDSMVSVVPYLEKGVIRGAVVSNAYNMGYLAVKAAVESIQGKRVERSVKIDFAVVTPSSIYTSENQRILFPFVK